MGWKHSQDRSSAIFISSASGFLEHKPRAEKGHPVYGKEVLQLLPGLQSQHPAPTAAERRIEEHAVGNDATPGTISNES